jgi:integrase
VALTVKRIAKLTAPGRYRDERGLYLQVASPTNRSWLLRYERDGRERWMGLGALHAFNLDEARERARKARQLLADGIDPLEAKKAERAAKALEAAKVLTFKEAAQQYFDGHERKWRNAKHRAQFLSTLKDYAFTYIGALPVGAIDTGLVLKVIEPIWQTKTETASRVRSRIERVLDWATVRGYRTGDNPARWRGHLDQVLAARNEIAKTQHHAALAYAELPALVKELSTREGIAARALEFTILTAARTGEVIGARWDEMDLAAGIWTVPEDRMKMKREHRVPLSASALAMLKALPREEGNDFVFVGGKEGAGLSNMAMAAVLKRMGNPDGTTRWVGKNGKPVVPHGFRSTFRDWAAESTAYPNHVVEMALAHTIGNKVEAAYRRGDLFEKRRRLMAEWAKYCASAPKENGQGRALSPPEPARTVVPIGQAR